jgi:hypothetical protein
MSGRTIARCCLILSLGIGNAQARKQVPRSTMSVDVFVQLVDSEALGRVRVAIDAFITSGDRTAVEGLLELACSGGEGTIRPSLKQYYCEAARKILNGILPDEVLDETTGETLLDRHLILKYETERYLSRFLILQLCKAENLHEGDFELSRGPLADRLRQHSQWIDETFSMSNEVLWSAKRVEPPVGGDAWILGASEAAIFLREANKGLKGNHDRALLHEGKKLVEILKAASDEQSKFRLLVRTF